MINNIIFELFFCFIVINYFLLLCRYFGFDYVFNVKILNDFLLKIKLKIDLSDIVK